MGSISSWLSGKNVLFITTKNVDYLRNTQEIELIKKYSKSHEVIGIRNNNYAMRILYVYYKILFKKNMKEYDVIFIGFAPQLVLPFLKYRFKRKKIIIDFFISIYDTLVYDRKKIRKDSFIASILKKIDIMTLSNADEIITDTKAHGKYFVSELKAEPKKINTLYLKADNSIYYPKTVERSPELKDKFIVLYFGSILPLQGVDIVLGAYDRLKNDADYYFFMIGDIGKKYKKPIANNIRYINWLPQRELADYIAMADLCLAGHFNKNIQKAKRTIPGKAYIYSAMDKTIILGDNVANRELFSELENKVYFVEMGNVEELVNKINEIKGKKNNG